MAVATCLGVILSIASAMIGGTIGEAIMRLTDLSLTLPGILIALAVAATVGPSLTAKTLTAAGCNFRGRSLPFVHETIEVYQSEHRSRSQ